MAGDRADEAWIAERLRGPDTVVLPVWQDRSLFEHGAGVRPALVPSSVASAYASHADSFIFLGELHGRPYFALGLPSGESGSPSWAAERGVFRDLRQVAPLVGHADGALLAYARAMVYWHRRHTFCGDCGHRTRSADAGHLRVCANPACGQHHFPRTDPAVITAVVSHERCLFGRKHSWPVELYSIIAGFVEPGESLETAVAREVYEETGIRVQDIEYRSSQPWPFPSSLMLGFTARAVSEEISLGDRELEDARWMSRPVVVAELSAARLRLPQQTSISFRLITEWFNAESSVSLAEVLQSVEISRSS